ncbi:hypothetical protein SLW73_17620 [Glutamicibacter protophormiae]|uniref:hypothetical protein n=1 Tax=Glutamicibacter protophormiae TaxID=37930 RepID=UPI002A80914F|nr:hypothetical protein [Glutamicibacter protophormiae]WPR66542.1 hypothetical protein SLW72_17625 [Glutamicibacter protophormiae]WPR70038.1 hypothetical protein SLW73_17620 [Glutamicibacter protophormiae]
MPAAINNKPGPGRTSAATPAATSNQPAISMKRNFNHTKNHHFAFFTEDMWPPTLGNNATVIARALD